MSTHAIVGYELPNGKFKIAGIHYDGYMEGVGKLLIKYFNSEKLAIKLISGGYMRSISGEGVPDYEAVQERDETSAQYVEKPDVDEIEDITNLIKNGYIDYIYIYIKNRWVVITGLYDVISNMSN